MVEQDEASPKPEAAGLLPGGSQEAVVGELMLEI